jgi:hypothetical protein
MSGPKIKNSYDSLLVMDARYKGLDNYPNV